jgi:RNA polymerase sigma factor (sigma-70 family)
MSSAVATATASSQVRSDQGRLADADLIRRLRETGSHECFAALVERYRGRVFRLAVSILGPGGVAEAEDVTQETFVLVHRRLHTFRSESRFCTWLYRLAYRRAVDYRRQARFRLPHVADEALESLPGGGPSSLEQLLATERDAQLVAAVAALGDPHRSAVYLHYWLGESIDSIAELLQVRPGTVKSYLHRSRKRLARLLQERSR